MDLLEYQKRAWTQEVRSGNVWTRPVTSREIDSARGGDWRVVLTPSKPVPRAWFEMAPGRRVLCLASGGGQQGPILAAAGFEVTVFDNCDAQLESDRSVAAENHLHITTIEGDMRDLSCFAGSSFDLIVHPVSNVFVDTVLPVWSECFRVLRPGGALMAGLSNPLNYIFDLHEMEAHQRLVVRNTIPYSDQAQLPPEELARMVAAELPLEFGHSLDDVIGGQIAAGFSLVGYYDDRVEDGLLDAHIATYMATCARKPGTVRQSS